MSKKTLVLTVILATVTLAANADYKSINGISAGSVDNTTIMIQNPVYVDNIGRSHFLSRGGYSNIRKAQDGQAYNDAVNAVSEKMNDSVKYSKDAEKNVSNVIGAPEEGAFSFGSTGSYYDKVRNNYDTSSDYPSGVNPSKTIYTDGIGRQHFFGKANLIK